MPVCLANVSRIWGGGEIWHYSMAASLHAQGYPVQVIAWPDSPLLRRCEAAGIPVTGIRLRTWSLLNPAAWLQVRRTLRAAGTECLILNASHELKTLGLMGRAAGVPQIVLRRGVARAFSRNMLNRLLLERVLTGWIAISEEIAARLVLAFPGLARLPLLLLPNGVDLARWRPQPAAARPGRLGIVARLSPEKGVDRALGVLPWLVPEAPEVHLTVWGEGPEQERLEALAARMCLQRRVSFAGFSEQLETDLAACQVFLFTARGQEGTTQAILQAMALGLPVVAFDTDSIRELVRDGETGFVVPDGDLEAMARKVLALLADDALRARMGAAGRQQAEAHHRWEDSVERALRWIENLSYLTPRKGSPA
ncbi:MAG: glycosyltransferase family 4 protein [Bacteroidia bacterium]|nr:glycosyltransferase family 4 protein [Bacteroidia bacterium]